MLSSGGAPGARVARMEKTHVGKAHPLTPVQRISKNYPTILETSQLSENPFKLP
jgi:hypothetical protein